MYRMEFTASSSETSTPTTGGLNIWSRALTVSLGPICDYHIFDFPDAESIPETSKRKNFIIEVPHIVKNIEEVNGKIQVMRQPNGSSVFTPIEPLLSQDNTESDAAFYSMEKNHIKISTPHFSRYIVTAKGINCCSGSAEMLIFSKMDMNGARPLFHVNIYLCSLHYVLQDYSQVCFGLILRKIWQLEKQV